MAKLLTAVSSAVFLWTFWYVSALGLYVGTYTSRASGEWECRYITARGFFDEPQADAATVHDLNSKWCPTTRVIGRDADARLKPARINTAWGQ